MAQKISKPVVQGGPPPAIPSPYGGRAVLDSKTGDVILIYKDEDGVEQRIVRELNNHVQPSVRTQLSLEQGSRRFQYAYSLKNEAGARQNADLWFFSGFKETDVVVSTLPPFWRQHRTSPESGGHPPDSLCLAVNSHAKVPEKEWGVPPGVVRQGFSLSSANLPGVVEVYVQGVSRLLVVKGELPYIQDENKYAAFPYNYRMTYAIGPKYPPTIGLAQFISGYLRDLDELVAAVLLDRHSRFFVDATQQIGRLRTHHLPIAEFSAAANSLRANAETPLEAEFSDTLSLAVSRVRDSERQ